MVFSFGSFVILELLSKYLCLFIILLHNKMPLLLLKANNHLTMVYGFFWVFHFFFSKLSCYNNQKCKTTLNLGLSLKKKKKSLLKLDFHGLNHHLRVNLVFYLMLIIIKKYYIFLY